MPKIYTNPIGPTQDGAGLPSESLAGQSTLGGLKMAGIPVPNLTGGAAGPSGATGGSNSNFINNVSGSGNVFLFALLAFAGYVAWKKFR